MSELASSDRVLARPEHEDKPRERPGDVVVHVYDDIRECDNRLPNWWLYGFLATIVFAAGYWFYFHVFGTGDTPLRAYQNEVIAAKKAEKARLMAMGELTEQGVAELAANPVVVREGEQQFTTYCVSCHAVGGVGNLGPNLTDRFWIHGSSGLAIARTVRDGVLDKGMPSWGPVMGEEGVRAVVAYVMTLKNTNQHGKAPQGKEEP
jgi:cytochrome c oxidase cbb3-type subunit 3